MNHHNQTKKLTTWFVGLVFVSLPQLHLAGHVSQMSDSYPS
jgi:hypothetical protein